MTSETMWVIGILIGVACGSLGFGLSQLTIAGVVKALEVEQRMIKESVERESKHTDDRIFEVVDLVKTSNSLVSKVIEQNTHLIAKHESRHNYD